MNDDEIRELLSRRAGEVADNPDELERVLTRAHERRRRQPRLIAVTAALATAAAVVVVALVVGGDDRKLVHTDPAATSTTEPDAIDPASRIVVARLDPETGGRFVQLVVLSTGDGHLVRTLFQRERIGEPDGFLDISVSADGWVYFVRDPLDSCAGIGDISRVRITGGPVEHVADGVRPRVSPDGSLLAYATPPGPPGCDASELVIRELSTGHEVRYSGNPAYADLPAPLGVISELTWLDQKRVVFVTCWDECDYARVLTRGEGGALRGRSTELRIEADDERLGDLVARPQGSIAVIIQCCRLSSGEMSSESYRIVAVDPANGRLTDLADPGEAVSELAVDPSGQHLAYITGHYQLVIDGRTIAPGGVLAIAW